MTEVLEVAGRLARLGAALRAHRQEVIGALTACETAQTAAREVDKTVRALLTYDREAVLLQGREPLGRVAVALPYNNPLYSFILYCGGPLLAGNSVRCRPSRLTAQSLVEICDLVRDELEELRIELELDESGAQFIDREYLTSASDAFLFTGAWRNARDLADARVATRLIYCGPGVNPFIVLGDADIDLAVDLALKARLFNSGQDCLAAERFYVDETVVDEFIEGLLRALESVPVGPNADPQVMVGPLVTPAAADHVRGLLDYDHPHRSMVLTGSIVDALVTPFVVVTDSDDPLVLAEKYAPVFVIVPFRSLEEAAELADSCEYFLGATVVGSAVGAKALRLRQPHVAVNECLIAGEEDDAHVPFGGSGRSGFVIDGSEHRDGPILFSVETSRVRSLDDESTRLGANLEGAPN